MSVVVSVSVVVVVSVVSVVVVVQKNGELLRQSFFKLFSAFYARLKVTELIVA